MKHEPIKLKCKFCGREMDLQESITNFSSNIDDNYLCSCGTTAIVKTRYDRLSSISWTIGSYHECEKVAAYERRCGNDQLPKDKLDK